VTITFPKITFKKNIFKKMTDTNFNGNIQVPIIDNQYISTLTTLETQETYHKDVSNGYYTLLTHAMSLGMNQGIVNELVVNKRKHDDTIQEVMVKKQKTLEHLVYNIMNVQPRPNIITQLNDIFKKLDRVYYKLENNVVTVVFENFKFPEIIYNNKNDKIALRVDSNKYNVCYERFEYDVRETYQILNKLCVDHVYDCIYSLNCIDEIYAVSNDIKIELSFFNNLENDTILYKVNRNIISFNLKSTFTEEYNLINIRSWQRKFYRQNCDITLFPHNMTFKLTKINLSNN